MFALFVYARLLTNAVMDSQTLLQSLSMATARRLLACLYDVNGRLKRCLHRQYRGPCGPNVLRAQTIPRSWTRTHTEPPNYGTDGVLRMEVCLYSFCRVSVVILPVAQLTRSTRRILLGLVFGALDSALHSPPRPHSHGPSRRCTSPTVRAPSPNVSVPTAASARPYPSRVADAASNRPPVLPAAAAAAAAAVVAPSGASPAVTPTQTPQWWHLQQAGYIAPTRSEFLRKGSKAVRSPAVTPRSPPREASPKPVCRVLVCPSVGYSFVAQQQTPVPASVSVSASPSPSHRSWRSAAQSIAPPPGYARRAVRQSIRQSICLLTILTCLAILLMSCVCSFVRLTVFTE